MYNDLIFNINTIQHTYLYCRHSRGNALFGETRVVFVEVRLADGTEVMRNANGAECKLENLQEISEQMKRGTEEKLALFGEKSNLVCLQSEVDQSFSDIPAFPEDDSIDNTENKGGSKSVSNVEKLYRSDGGKELYEILHRFGDVRTNSNARLFVNMLSDDIQKNAKTGITIDNLQDTWLGNNDEKSVKRGVFNAIHPKGNNGGGKIQNSTFLEYKKGKDSVQAFVSKKTLFLRDFSEEYTEKRQNLAQIQQQFFATLPSIENDAISNLQKKGLFSEIPNLYTFLQTKITKPQTPQLSNNTSTSTEAEGVFEGLSSAVIEKELKKINILQRDGVVQHSEEFPSGSILTDGEKQILQEYKNILEGMRSINLLKQKKNILEKVDVDNNGGDAIDFVNTKISTIINRIKELKHKKLIAENEYPVNDNKIALLEQDIRYLQEEKDFYKDLQDMTSSLNPMGSLYDDIFEHVWRDGKIVATKVKNMNDTISDLHEYSEWIMKTLFEGIPTPSNPDVRAVLVSSAYRGNFSPQQLNEVLLNMYHGKKNIAEFYEQVATVMYASDDGQAQEDFLAYISSHTEFSAISFKLHEASFFWNDTLAGNTAHFDESNPLILREENSREEFKKNWGFNIRLAYAEYKKLRVYPVKPSEDNLQNSLKKNNQVLDISLWITRDKETQKSMVNDSPEMKSYLSQLLQKSLRISSDEEIGEKIDSLEITDEKKAIYKKIIAGEWQKDDAEVMVFVQTLKSEFTEEEKIDQRFALKNSRVAVESVVKSFDDDGSTIMESVSYIWDRATSLDPTYVGVVGLFAYLMMKDNSGEEKSGLLSLFKTVAWGAGGAALINSVSDDMFDVDLFAKGKELIMGEDKNMQFSPSGVALLEMKKVPEENEDMDSKEFKRAGVALSNGNVKETLDWYTHCQKLQADPNRSVNDTIYTQKLPSGIKHLISHIYADEGSVGAGHSKEDAAHKVFTFLELYFKSVSLQLHPNAGDGAGNANMGYTSIADEFYYPDENENKTYTEVGTDILKQGYTMGEVMRARVARESILKFDDEMNSIADAVDVGVQNTSDFVGDVVASVGDKNENTVQTDEKIQRNIQRNA